MAHRTVNTLDFSKFLVSYFDEMDNPLTHLKLQKLIYFCDGWSLGNFGVPMVNEEPKAWANGPVYRSVYDAYKENKGDEIEAQEDWADSLKIIDSLGLSDNQKSLTNAVLKNYGEMSALRLVNKTHAQKPWIDARGDAGPFDIGNNTITHEAMKDYFQGLLSTSK